MPLNYYIYSVNEEERTRLIRQWLRRYEMMNGIEKENEDLVDYKGNDYLCRMDYCEYKRKQKGGYSHKYVVLYENIDELDLMQRNLDKEIEEIRSKNPGMIILITARHCMNKYPQWLNKIYQKYSFCEINADQQMNQIIPFLSVENNIPEPEILRFKFKYNLKYNNTIHI